MGVDDSLPDDMTTLKAMLRAERTARLAAEADAQAQTLLIEKLKLTIRKLRHEQFGQSSERGALLDQLELQLTDLEENAAQAETAAQMAAADKIAVAPFARRKPARRPLPEHLPRERIVYPVPATCPVKVDEPKVFKSNELIANCTEAFAAVEQSAQSLSARPSPKGVREYGL